MDGRGLGLHQWETETLEGWLLDVPIDCMPHAIGERHWIGMMINGLEAGSRMQLARAASERTEHAAPVSHQPNPLALHDLVTSFHIQCGRGWTQGTPLGPHPLPLPGPLSRPLHWWQRRLPITQKPHPTRARTQRGVLHFWCGSY